MHMPDLPDLGLETLLDLNGIIYRLSKGYWVKFEAYSVSQTAHIPHGVSYSITLHDRNNTRVLGFDNAHGSNPRGRKKFGGRKISWDHKHRYEVVLPYEYDSAAQLLEDFWVEVDRISPPD